MYISVCEEGDDRQQVWKAGIEALEQAACEEPDLMIVNAKFTFGREPGGAWVFRGTVEAEVAS